MDFPHTIRGFDPGCEQERADKAVFLSLMAAYPDSLLTRDCSVAHLTSSAFIFNPALTKCLMVYHNLYDSWSFSGGHADGDNDLMGIAVREAREETGISGLRPLSPAMVSLDVLPVFAHLKRGVYVSAHLHLSVTYAFVGDERAPLRIKPDENSAVGWLDLSDLEQRCTEAHMLPIYSKIIRRARALV